MDLAKEAEITVAMVGLVSGSSDGNGASVDMAGYGAVCFILTIGTQDAAADCLIKAQHSDDDGNFDDIPGAQIQGAVNQANKLLVLNIANPTKRYIRPQLTRGGTVNSESNGIIAIRYKARRRPAPSSTLYHAATPVSISVP